LTQKHYSSTVSLSGRQFERTLMFFSSFKMGFQLGS